MKYNLLKMVINIVSIEKLIVYIFLKHHHHLWQVFSNANILFIFKFLLLYTNFFDMNFKNFIAFYLQMKYK